MVILKTQPDVGMEGIKNREKERGVGEGGGG